jgi:hypothetical protein
MARSQRRRRYSCGRKLVPNDGFGGPTGEVLFNIQPRSCLIIGDLLQFHIDLGINEDKFRSFELYRRNTARPKILIFDELLERARFIISDGHTTSRDEDDDRISF